MEWAWDENNARANVVKHGVSFELAVRVFEDPFHLTRADPHPQQERWRTMGQPFPGHPLLLFVVDAEHDGEGGRIISARKATSHERKAYEEAPR